MNKPRTKHFMRDKDLKMVKENVNNLVQEARNREIQLIEPTLEEFKKIKSIILNYIKKEKKIIYGGYAWNSLVKHINPNDAFYSDTDFTDVEFYSNTPIHDMKKLCDILHTKGFKFIQGKNAQHNDTYTIFVNFQAYCDISYMPSNIYFNIMTYEINGFRLIHPKYIMIDILRQFTDPITSYWRLEKNIKRGELIINNFPFEMSAATGQTSNHIITHAHTQKLINYILPQLANIKSLLFIGSIAEYMYLNSQNYDVNADISENQTIYDNKIIEIISTNLSEHVELVYNLIVQFYLSNKANGSLGSSMVSTFEDDIVLEQYHPFFQIFDKKAIFKFKGVEFLTIYGNNEKCIPFTDVKLNFLNTLYPIKIGTFNVVFMFVLGKYHHAYVNRNIQMQNYYDNLLYDLLEQRDSYLTSNDKTILDVSIYQDFKAICLGEPISPMRKFFISRRDRRLLTKSAIQPYDPESEQEYDLSKYSFPNCSGNIINNPKDMIYVVPKKSSSNIITNYDANIDSKYDSNYDSNSYTNSDSDL